MSITSVQKFQVTIGEKVCEFDTEAEAIEALAKVDLLEEAIAYTDARGLEGKNAAARRNVVLDFLAYKAGLAGTESVKEDEDIEA